MMRIIFSISFLFYSVLAIADPTFYHDQKKGWHWYSATPAKEEELEKLPALEDETPIIAAPQLEDPKAELARLQDTVETAKAKAVLDPTPENIKSYIELQNAVQAQATKFATTWQTVLWSNPHLDVSLQKPTNQKARQIYTDQHKQDKSNAIYEWSQTHGLFYFFRSDCPYCQAFAPVLKQFEATYGVNIIAISLDGQTLPEYPNARVDNGAAERLGVSTVPALFAIEPTTQAVTPITFGLISMDDLTERLWQLSLSNTGVSSHD